MVSRGPILKKYGMLCTIATLLLASMPLVSGQGTVHVNNVPPTISAPSIYDEGHVHDVNNTMIDPASGGAVKEYQVTATIGDDNTLYDIKNVTVYVYDDNAVTGHGFVNGTYNEVGSYGFAWVNATGVVSWKELHAGGVWNGTYRQFDLADSTYPLDLSQSSGNWVFEFSMNKVSRRTATAGGWKVQIYVCDGSDAKAVDSTLQFGVNFYHEETVVTAVTWSGATLGRVNQTADGNHLNLYNCTVTANAPFRIKIRSLMTQLTGTHGQTPFDVTNVAIDTDDDHGFMKTVHLSTSWQDFDTNVPAGSNIPKESYWFITIPSVTRDDIYTFNFAIQIEEL